MRLLSVIELGALGIDKSCGVELSVELVVVAAQDDVEFFDERRAVLGEEVGEEEVGIEEAAPLGVLPVDGDGGLHVARPLLVDEDEVVARDGQRRGLAVRALSERLADKCVEFNGVLVEAEEAEIRFKERTDAVEDETELAGVGIGRRDVPVEVVLVEDVDDLVIGDEGDLLAVEGAKEGRGKMLVECAGLAES